jgi:hypothetical protein
LTQSSASTIRTQGLTLSTIWEPSPHLACVPDAVTFHNNTLCTYNVFQAARRASIKRLVYASSETLLGLPFDIDPPCIPVDEEYQASPESTYSLVTHLEEQMAVRLARWDPELTITALRFSNVMYREAVQPSPPSKRAPCCANGTCGATPTVGMEPRPSCGPWRTGSRVLSLSSWRLQTRS